MTPTYDQRVQLGASRRRREDAEALHSADCWTGAIYLGGYTIECALKSLICYNEGKTNFKDTKIFRNGLSGNSLHSLTRLLAQVPSVQRAIQLDLTNTYKPDWKTIQNLWQKDALRYSEKKGNQQDSQRFIRAVKQLHGLLLSQQGEAS